MSTKSMSHDKNLLHKLRLDTLTVNPEALSALTQCAQDEMSQHRVQLVK